MANAAPIKILEIMRWKGQIKTGTDVFKLIAMKSGFVYDPLTHLTYADVAASELPTGNGYTAGGVTLTGTAVAWNATDNRTELTFANVTITAAGGTLVSSGGIIFDDTPDTGSGDDATDPIISYKDAFGDVSAVSGTPITFVDIKETDEDITE
jgi:hypothetical protein